MLPLIASPDEPEKLSSFFRTPITAAWITGGTVLRRWTLRQFGMVAKWCQYKDMNVALLIEKFLWRYAPADCNSCAYPDNPGLVVFGNRATLSSTSLSSYTYTTAATTTYLSLPKRLKSYLKALYKRPVKVLLYRQKRDLINQLLIGARSFECNSIKAYNLSI